MNRFDTGPQKTPIRFKLSFPRTAKANAAFLSLKVRPASDQAGGHVLQLSKLNLKFTLVSARTLGKDIKDEACAVKHTTGKRTLKIALLRGGQRVVKDHNFSLVLYKRGLDLLNLTFTNKCFGMCQPTRTFNEYGRRGTCRAD